MISHKSSGFTLLEILIVLSLLALVTAAISGSLVQGIKMYKRFSQASEGQDTALFFERMTRDLKNKCDFSLRPSVFGTEEMVFATTQNFVAADQTILADYPLLVEYRFDPQKTWITRAVSRYPCTERREEVVLTQVRSVRYDWLMVGDNQPMRVGISLKRDGPSRDLGFDRMIMIPTGYIAKSE